MVRESKKEQIIDGAVGIFAERGYYKATTALVAKAAGVTQPYVFHFFKNKEELFLAVIDRAMNRMRDAFNQAEAPADQLTDTMGGAFMEILEAHRDETLMVMQAYVIAEPQIREHVRGRYELIYDTISAKYVESGLPPCSAAEAASKFMGMGLLITASEVLGLPRIACLDLEV
ncbi:MULTISPECIES: TetR/AcrR family transcriptional regulator [Paenibacillus]|uniref:TetR/AcrR family transcriptional regulator n=1 Tax=Paenibacillus TaxID=44249 RepID=UPI0022B91403|nr:TetR/AcrR family transcriptional regulator [Paenibacillus caseinilyticus]MCZ8521240.1 TetR/AcrR family transcriptional regulator [Paenibacillus caseinilyticus]